MDGVNNILATFAIVGAGLLSLACGNEAPTMCRMPDNRAVHVSKPVGQVKILSCVDSKTCDTCQGMIVGHHTVMTAAHCLRTGFNYWVIKTPTARYTTTTRVVHTEWATGSEYNTDTSDIGLLYVDAKLPDTSAKIDYADSSNRWVYIVDHNVMKHDVQLFSGYDIKVSETEYRSVEWHYLSDMVAGSGTSGAPVFDAHTGMIVGVVSGLQNTSCVNFVTRLDKVGEWLVTHIK